MWTVSPFVMYILGNQELSGITPFASLNQFVQVRPSFLQVLDPVLVTKTTDVLDDVAVEVPQPLIHNKVPHFDLTFCVVTRVVNDVVAKQHTVCNSQ